MFYLPEKAKFKAVVHEVNAILCYKEIHRQIHQGTSKAKDTSEASNTIQSPKKESPSSLYTTHCISQTDPALNPIIDALISSG